MNERQIQNDIIKLLRLNGWFAYAADTKGTFDPVKKVFRANPSRVTGVSDILAIKKGRVLFLEVKTPDNESGPLKNGQSDNQIEFERNIKAQGGEYYVVRSIHDVQVIMAYKTNSGIYGC